MYFGVDARADYFYGFKFHMKTYEFTHTHLFCIILDVAVSMSNYGMTNKNNILFQIRHSAIK